jgi:hypothetical protein
LFGQIEFNKKVGRNYQTEAEYSFIESRQAGAIFCGAVAVRRGEYQLTETLLTRLPPVGHPIPFA